MNCLIQTVRSLVHIRTVFLSPSFRAVNRVFRRMRLIRGLGDTIVADLALDDEILLVPDALLLVPSLQVGSRQLTVHFRVTDAFTASGGRHHFPAGGQIELTRL